jgi:hypothetical protein
MSLVSDALRKARAEAAEREGRGRGIPRALALPPKRWRSGPGLVLLLVIVVVAAVGGASVAWWALGRRTPAPATTTGGVAPAGPARTSPNAQATTLPSPPPASAAPPPAARPAPAAVGESAAPAATATAVPAIAGASAHAPPPAPATSGRATETGDEGRPRARASNVGEPKTSQGERSFIIDADLGYVKLHLDYIVYRPGSPFASINGGQVMVGSLIEGFNVEEITDDFVRLHDTHGTVVLRVR